MEDEVLGGEAQGMAGELGLNVIPGIRQVRKSRLDQSIGAVPASLMARISEALTRYLED